MLKNPNFEQNYWLRTSIGVYKKLLMIVLE